MDTDQLHQWMQSRVDRLEETMMAGFKSVEEQAKSHKAELHSRISAVDQRHANSDIALADRVTRMEERCPSVDRHERLYHDGSPFLDRPLSKKLIGLVLTAISVILGSLWLFLRDRIL